MIRNTKVFFCLLTVAFLGAGSAQANTGFEFGHFRASHVSVVQTGGSSFSGLFTWNPGYGVDKDIAIRLTLGGTALKNRAGDIFPRLEYGALGAYRLSDSLELEAGAGFQYWMENGGNRLMAMANGNYYFAAPLVGMMDRLVLGYAAVFVPTKLSHEARLGVGLSF